MSGLQGLIVVLWLSCSFNSRQGETRVAKKSGPYVGVTGFMSRAEISEALSIVPQRSTHRLMVGILMSSKTLAGQQNKWPSRYPKKESVADIFVDDPRALNLIHYNTDHRETLFTQLAQITELAGPYLDGFQLNIAWPQISQLEDYRATHPEKFILLQIGSRAMAEVESTDDFAEFVGAYLHVIDAVLIDSSGGKGEPLNAEKAADYLWSIQYYPIGLGVAGGLGPRTLHLIDPLVRDFRSRLSIDAEGKLRTKTDDVLCLDAMKSYLAGSFLILGNMT